MEPSDKNPDHSQAWSFDSGLYWMQQLFCLLALAGLFLLYRSNYLLYHGIVEGLSVVVAVTIFSIGWNSKGFVQDNTLLVLAVAYLSVGAIDFLHLLSYKGMGVFPDYDSNLATQLWIAARYLESLALIWAALLVGRKSQFSSGWLLTGGVLAGSLLVASVVPMQFFPVCYVEGEGLTAFKVASEYVISCLLALAALIFWQRRHHLNRKILVLIVASIVFTVLSELSFTLYIDVYGLFNFVGHALKLVSVLLIYVALVQGSLKSPYKSLFRKLSLELKQRKASEEKLYIANRELDAFVHTVSHDLRSPLTPITGYAEYLNDKWGDTLDEEARKLLQLIHTLGMEMSLTMEDLLTLARVGKLDPPEQPVPAEAVVDKVLLMRGSHLSEVSQNVTRHPLPEACIPESLLWQMFDNLIGNALNYADGAEIEVGGERCDGMVRYFVRDHGPGIPTDECGHIFELFSRAAATNNAKGNGVGLAIVKKIARIYHGKAWAEETPGGGVTFWVEMDDTQEAFE